MTPLTPAAHAVAKRVSLVRIVLLGGIGYLAWRNRGWLASEAKAILAASADPREVERLKRRGVKLRKRELARARRG